MENEFVGKVYLENLGCAKNQVDGEVMLNRLAENGWQITDDLTEADLLLINTCAFIESAKKESLEVFFADNNLRKPGSKIIVTGCLAQRYGKDLASELKEADGVFGNYDLGKVSDFVSSVYALRRHSVKCLVPEYPDPEDEFDRRGRLLSWPGSAFLKISEGCNHRCAYCAIPLIRGGLRSKPESAVVADAKRLIASGVREINVVAQDLAAFGSEVDGKSRFIPLLEKLCALEGEFKIRMLYIHPDAFPAELPRFVKKHSDRIVPYFDIPFQHSHPSVLAPMGRTGNRESYSRLVESIRKELPDAVIRTTIMLGFPTETEESLADVKRFVEDVKFDWMGMFLYSKEEGTRAVELVSAKQMREALKIAKAAKAKLENIQEKITSACLERFVSTVQDVLIEETIDGEDLAIGRIYAQAPEVDGQTVVMGRDLKPGQVYRCAIRKVNGVDLEAVLL